MIRSSALGGIALSVILTVATAPELAVAAHHEPVTQAVTVRVKPGQLAKYRQEVKKLVGVLARVGSKATIRMWQATAAGENTGAVLVGVEYANEAAWAADSGKTQGDAEWQKIVAGLDELRTLESNGVWRDITPSPSSGAPGSLLLVTAVQVKPGKLETYRERIKAAQAILERLGLKGRMRMWHAELAGPATGSVVVGMEYPDLPTYVAEQAKIDADPEWQKILSGLDEIRTLVGRSLYQEITP